MILRQQYNASVLFKLFTAVPWVSVTDVHAVDNYDFCVWKGRGVGVVPLYIKIYFID